MPVRGSRQIGAADHYLTSQYTRITKNPLIGYYRHYFTGGNALSFDQQVKFRQHLPAWKLCSTRETIDRVIPLVPLKTLQCRRTPDAYEHFYNCDYLYDKY